jgi:hypothetical protein
MRRGAQIGGLPRRRCRASSSPTRWSRSSTSSSVRCCCLGSLPSPAWGVVWGGLARSRSYGRRHGDGTGSWRPGVVGEGLPCPRHWGCWSVALRRAVVPRARPCPWLAGSRPLPATGTSAVLSRLPRCGVFRGEAGWGAAGPDGDSGGVDIVQFNLSFV